MALLDHDDELARSRPGSPFSNGFEGDAWMSLWCMDCRHEPDCPLILVALTGRTPEAWEEINPLSLTHRYTCREFEKSEEEQK